MKTTLIAEAPLPIRLVFALVAASPEKGAAGHRSSRAPCYAKGPPFLEVNLMKRPLSHALLAAVFASLASADCGTPGGLLPDGGPAGGNGACVPETGFCETRGKNCGALSVTDRCGKTSVVTCGTCSAPMTCGGAGTENVCGATCPGGCPSGFSCSLGGACVGGLASGLVLDVKTVPVSGTVTLNGAAPVVGAGCLGLGPTSNMVTLTFADLATGTDVTSYVPCTAANFAFSTQLAPGTYRVSVGPYITDRSNLPAGTFVVNAALAVTAPLTGVVLDVKSVPVSGTVTLNGAAPVVGAGCLGLGPTSNMVTLSFADFATGTAVTSYVPCTAANFAFSTQLAPGTYRVSVGPYITDRSNLPGGSFVVNAALAVTAPLTGVVLDVKSVPVSGTVTLNGAAPVVGAGCLGLGPTSSMVTLSFTDLATGTAVTSYVPCTAANFAFSTRLAPGTYRVGVGPYINDRSNLPAGTFVVNAALAVTAPLTGVVLDVKTVPVSGTVTLNGAAPVVGAGCAGLGPTSSMVTLTFAEPTSGTHVTTYVPCTATNFAFTSSLASGTWRVLAGAYIADRTNVPAGTFVVNAALSVTGPSTGVVLDVKTVPVSGTVTLNGAKPVVGAGCAGLGPTSNMVTLTFVDASAPPTFSFLDTLRALPTARVTAYVPCTSTQFAFTTALTPGVYRVSVGPYITDRSNLPGGTFVVVPRLEVK